MQLDKWHQVGIGWRILIWILLSVIATFVWWNIPKITGIKIATSDFVVTAYRILAFLIPSLISIVLGLFIVQRKNYWHLVPVLMVGAIMPFAIIFIMCWIGPRCI